ncbi:MAG: hypothetical protein O3A65_04645 [Proteobacteria bacterium]|nr:hypothetical protein [Pseudomonadota bacterium]
MVTKLTTIAVLLIVVEIAAAQAQALDSYCKLTVNGGIGINGPCEYNQITGEFNDGLLKTACRSGLETCNPNDLEVIRGGSFGYIVPNDGRWEFCWNQGGYIDINECFFWVKTGA